MVTCTQCGAAMQPQQKFCPNCGAKNATAEAPTAVTPPPPPPVASGPAVGTATGPTQMAGTSCPSCGSPVANNVPFCQMCGTCVSGQATAAPATGSMIVCPNCAQQVNSSSPFCQHCGTKLQAPATYPQQGVTNYGIPAQPPSPYGPPPGTAPNMQPGQYPMQQGMQSGQYGQPGQYPMQPGMQPGQYPMQQGMQQPGQYPMQPGMQYGQPGMPAHCPTCNAFLTPGTTFCTQCGTNLANLPPQMMPQQQQQQGGLGGMFGNMGTAGKVGLGVAGGLAAAFIGHEILEDIEGGGMGGGGLIGGMLGGGGGGIMYDEDGRPYRHRRGLMGEIIRDFL